MDGYEPVFALAAVTIVVQITLCVYLVGSRIHRQLRGTRGEAMRFHGAAPRRNAARETPWRPVWHRKAS